MSRTVKLPPHNIKGHICTRTVDHVLSLLGSLGAELDCAALTHLDKPGL